MPLDHIREGEMALSMSRMNARVKNNEPEPYGLYILVASISENLR